MGIAFGLEVSGEAVEVGGSRRKSTKVRFSLNQYSSIKAGRFEIAPGGVKVNDKRFKQYEKTEITLFWFDLHGRLHRRGPIQLHHQ